MTNQLKLRATQVTQATFDKLPALLTRFQFQWVTGLSDRDLSEMAKSSEIKTWKRNGGKYCKYYKSDAAKIGNFKL